MEAIHTLLPAPGSLKVHVMVYVHNMAFTFHHDLGANSTLGEKYLSCKTQYFAIAPQTLRKNQKWELL